MSGRAKAAAQAAIERHGAIGNPATAALVDPTGAIVWCCLPEFDSPSVFAAMLDARRGGHFRVAPRQGCDGRQRYLEDSNVLETGFDLGEARLTLVDYMPVRRRGGRLSSGGAEIHRVLSAQGHAVQVEVEWSPRFDYARGPTSIAAHDGSFLAAGGDGLCMLHGLPPAARCRVVASGSNQTLRARFTLAPGEPLALTMRWGGPAGAAQLRPEKALARTLRVWREWAALGHATDWAGKHAALVRRSALALKLLCHADTGSIAAAATTSLPEAIGGERNWDYRYVWLRDAGMTVEALLGAGHPQEVGEFLAFIARAAKRPNPHGPWLQLLFGLRGETELPLVVLEHLDGYRGSRPVRLGNSITRHRGHDVYEQVMGAALEYATLGHPLAPAVRRFLGRAADLAAQDWRHPDNGIWEIPGGPKHYVHSKWTLSMALDHAIRLAREQGIPGDAQHWSRERDACRAQVLAQGFDERRGAFRISYDDDALDSANVLMPVLGFLPADDPRVVSNLRRTLRELMTGDLCYRYRLDDGLRGAEGCFVACSFWMIEALVLAGELARARRLFDRIARRASPLGLWAEEIDPRDGRHLGNFPQAFSHVAFHDAALRLAAAEGTRVPVPADPAGLAQGAGRRKTSRKRAPAGEGDSA